MELLNYLDKTVSKKNKMKCSNLMENYFQTIELNKKMSILHEAFLLDPTNPNVLVQYGMHLINNSDKIREYSGYILLEKAFSLPNSIPIDCYQGRWIACMIGRYNHLIHNYKTTEKFYKLANQSKYNPDDTHKIQLATLITGYPESIENAKQIIYNYNKQMDIILNKKKLNTSFIESTDMFNFLIMSIFNLEIYYEANFRECMHKNYELSIKLFPDLHYISPKINNFNKSIMNDNNNNKKKIGIISAFFEKNHSVIADFGGVIRRLPRDKYDITLIYLIENKINNKNNDADEFIFPDENYIIVKSYEDKDWLKNTRKQIENLELDLLFYLDSTMSSVIQRTMMSKLAKIQAVSHGHPVTSGISSKIMDYFISWGAAELDTAQEHYTENLVLLRKNYMHQYYEPRTINGISIISNESYLDYTRDDFPIPTDKNWYTCMQKPFKLHPEFDFMLSEILKRDLNACIILHSSDLEENIDIQKKRYINSGCDMNRIYFLPAQAHHKLMALYGLSDVILDSYHAGGCTTSREALEIGAPIVTLPAKYLGGRWTLAYYNIIGVNDLIANSKEEYINLAVKVGSNYEYKIIMKEKILNNVHKLFKSQDAIDSWVIVFDKILENI